MLPGVRGYQGVRGYRGQSVKVQNGQAGRDSQMAKVNDC